MAQYGFLFNQSRCVGCNACTVACKDWNGVDIGPVRWRQARFYEISDQLKTVVMGCNHCAEPACMAECPFDAISKDEATGMVTIDRDKCESCGTCLEVCPFHMSQIADDVQEPEQKESWIMPHPAQKCTMCPDRLADGLVPVCVAGCPTRALKFGDMQELMKEPGAVQMNMKDYPYVYDNAPTETKPSLVIIPKHDVKVTKLK